MLDTFKRSTVLFVIGFIFSILISVNLWAQTFTVDVIADQQTMIPGGTGTFTDFDAPVYIGMGEDIVFRGRAPASSQIGIYTVKSGLFSVVMDLNTTIPGGSGNFTNSTDVFSPDIGDAGFTGLGSSSQRGIYTLISGTLGLVVDKNTSIPGGVGNFTSTGVPVSLGNGDVAFTGSGSSSQSGIYRSISGVLSAVADESTAIPGGTGNFTGFSIPRLLGDGDVVFRGLGSSSQSGIYTFISGTLGLGADENTAIPGGSGNFTNIEDPVFIDNKDFAFEGSGSGGQSGIYRSISGILSLVVDENTPIPSGSGNFTNFGNLVWLDNGNTGDLIFTASGSGGQSGVYEFISGALNVVADLNTPIPNGSGNFTSFSSPVSINGNVAFRGVGAGGQSGIYAWIDGNLVSVVDINTPIPSGTGNFTGIGSPVALSGLNIAFFGLGSDGQEGIYKALIDTGFITISKETNPDGDSGFEFMGTGFPEDCDMDGTFILDDDGFEECDVITGMYTIQETNSQGLAISDIDCLGASSFSVNQDSVTIDLMKDENVVCTFTNTEQYDLNINLAGDGVGNVSASGINCGNGGSDCMETYISGTEVTLTATPDAVSSFVSFTGDPDCSDGVVAMDADKSCTATFDYIPLILNQIFPGIANNINQISADQTTPNGSLAFLWGFQPGSVIVGGPTCNGLQLDIKSPRILSIVTAGANQIANFTFFIPNLGDFELPILTQAVDIPTCRKSGVVVNVIRKE